MNPGAVSYTHLDDVYVVMPNQFGMDEFDLEDAYGEQKGFMCSADLKEFVEKNHLNLSQDGSFIPRDIFGSHDDSDHVYNTPRAWYMPVSYTHLDGMTVTGYGPEAVGRMQLKGDLEMSGYWKREPETAAALVDGWLVTNDLVYRDEDGFVYMLGRADDMINTGGEDVYKRQGYLVVDPIYSICWTISQCGSYKKE